MGLQTTPLFVTFVTKKWCFFKASLINNLKQSKYQVSAFRLRVSVLIKLVKVCPHQILNRHPGPGADHV